MSNLPTRAQLRAVIVGAAAEPDATSGTIADAVLEHLRAWSLVEAGPCVGNGCPHAAVPGLDWCAEHAAQEITTLRQLVRESEVA